MSSDPPADEKGSLKPGMPSVACNGFTSTAQGKVTTDSMLMLKERTPGVPSPVLCCLSRPYKAMKKLL